MQAWHQKNIFNSEFPFNLFYVNNIEFAPHWHEGIEILHVLEGSLKVGVNHGTFLLSKGDVMIIGAGEVHYFLSRPHDSKSLFIQFGLSVFEVFSKTLNDRRFHNYLMGNSIKLTAEEASGVYHEIEKQIKLITEEYENKRYGYQMALKARLYDILILLMRSIPVQEYSHKENLKRLNRLERLEKVLRYVEEHFWEQIALEEVAREANFSVYHFSRFFKESTGMTFGQYLSIFRVKKAEWFLANNEESVTQLALKSGFNSIKTFNRVFKEIKGCSPSEYKKRAKSER